MATVKGFGGSWFPENEDEWNNMSYDETAYIMYGVDIDNKKKKQ